jgi:hypothetical protein
MRAVLGLVLLIVGCAHGERSSVLAPSAAAASSASVSDVPATLDDLIAVAVRLSVPPGQPERAATLVREIVTRYWELVYASAEVDARAVAVEMARSQEPASRPTDVQGVRYEIAVREEALLRAQLNVEQASLLLRVRAGLRGDLMLKLADPAIPEDEIPPGDPATARQMVDQADGALERAEHDLEARHSDTARRILEAQADVTSARVARARAVADLREALAEDELARGTLLAHHGISFRNR